VHHELDRVHDQEDERRRREPALEDGGRGRKNCRTPGVVRRGEERGGESASGGRSCR
jgi:hypothetical protein